MADDIEVKVDFVGTEQAARGAERVAGAVGTLAEREDRAAQAARDLAAKQTALATQSIQLSQRLAGAAMATQALVTQFGSESRTAGLIGATVTASAQFAQLGSALGPHGALVGGIVGALIPAMTQIINGSAEAEEATRAYSEAVRGLEQAYEDAAERAREYNRDALGRAETAVATARRVLRERRLLSGNVENGDEAQVAIALINERITRLREEGVNSEFAAGQIEVLTAARERARTAAVDAAEEEQEERRRRERGPVDSTDYGAESDARVRAATEAFAEQVEAQKALSDDLREQNFQNHQEEMAEHGEKMNAIREQIELEEQAALDRMRQAQENDELLEELNRNAADRARARVEEYQSVTGVIVGGLTEALVAIVSGQKSAEEAFKGLLASFLTFISEQSALKAASEFAFAIADFASQNYAGGVQHLAAGVAFTAVAVAAGAGGAALSAPSAAAAGPQEGASSKDRDSGGGGGGNVTVNWNAPVYTSSQRAEMGRELGGLITEARDRF